MIVGAARAGKTETLRRLLDALDGREELELSARAGGRAARGDRRVAARDRRAGRGAQLRRVVRLAGQAVERAIEAAKRVAARGGDAVVLIDGLDGLQPARRAQGARGGAQPARGRLADGDRDRRRSRSAARRR